ncbi:hypothetical protein KDJ57_gp61 [Gordonia phage Catfish]|uniref:Uncharacterized protein n=1 Tax=Gordonia phage Catfish TaxID=2301538 RepID=A0A385D1I6_9CAUD|nr:hypothetical protein KDJ57_gp61 [Gordonia phage Catfish]AXQ51884.1 hypothetical protein SEA_CATFISH_48 [Gordonia phage Catfish]
MSDVEVTGDHWTLTADGLKAIVRRAEEGGTRPADTWRLIGRVQQLEAIVKALESERDIATSVAEDQGTKLEKMRELRDSGTPGPTVLAGLLYWLRD